jgi:hypothetical protein
MERTLRKFALLLVICVATVCASFGLEHNTYAARAEQTKVATTTTCSSYVIDGGAHRYTQTVARDGYSFSLWYNACTRQNYASLNTLGMHASGQLTVERASGPDGGDIIKYATVNGRGIFKTPGIYAPQNAARACFQNNADYQVQCTPWTDQV